MVETERETSEVFRERVIKEGSWKEEEDINNMSEKMATNIRKVTSEVCGVTKEVEARLKILGGGTRKYNGLLRRRKNAIDACTMTGVWTT